VVRLICADGADLRLDVASVLRPFVPSCQDNDDVNHQKINRRMSVVDRAFKIIQDNDAWLREMYIQLHKNPEEAFDEFKTAAMVQAELTKLGFVVKSGIATTGIAAVLENGPGPVLAYRADMDCNAVQEETGLQYSSKVTRTRPDGTTVPLAHLCTFPRHRD
jgi:metal-dependent amidase/aminoacylase/carboxypeptidase family protein